MFSISAKVKVGVLKKNPVQPGKYFAETSTRLFLFLLKYSVDCRLATFANENNSWGLKNFQNWTDMDKKIRNFTKCRPP